METKTYTPNPVNTENIELPNGIVELAEKIAENCHDEWAKTRIQQGWTYGAERNDTKKEHPCLVPYNQLPEDEKVFDRNTALGTLRLIVALGYKITK